MTTFEKIVEAVENKLQEVGKDNIDYGATIDNRFYYECQGLLKAKIITLILHLMHTIQE